MAKIPDATSLISSAAPRSQRSIVSFDSKAGDGLVQAGKQLSQAGAELQTKADENAKLLSQSYANDVIVNQFAPKAAELRAKYYDNQGINATTALPQYQSDLDVLRKSTLGSTEDVYTQNLLGHFMVSHVTQELDGASRYAVDQKNKYITGTNTAMLNNLSSQASLAYNDPSAVESNRANAHAIIDNQSDIKGMANPDTGENPVADAAKKKWDGENALGMIDTALANNDLIHANAIYNQYKDSMDGDKSLAASKSLDILNKRQDGATTIATLKAGRPIISQQDPSDVVMKNELNPDGSVSVINDSKGLVIGGINRNSYPKQFDEAKSILESQGQDAAKSYIKGFYQKEIIKKNGVDRLPADVQDVVADGLTNHGAGFQAKLLAAAQGGATRSQLLDMRQSEYDKLAASPNAAENKWDISKAGWDNRIKALRNDRPSSSADASQARASLPMFKEGVNPSDTFKNWQEAYPAYSSEIMKISDPQDKEDRLKALDSETSNYKHQSDAFRAGIVNQAIQLSVKITSMDQVPIDTYKILLEDHPETIKELSAAADRNLKKAGSLATQDTTKNTPAGYDVVMRTLIDDKHDSNRISSQDHLDKELGNGKPSSINMKDYSAAKQLLEEKDPMFLKAVRDTMNGISSANGNVDGGGQLRAMSWLDAALQTRKKNGDKLDIKELKMGPQPSRMEQISNKARALSQGVIDSYLQTPAGRGELNIPLVASVADPALDALKSGDKFKTPDGQIRIKQ